MLRSIFVFVIILIILSSDPLQVQAKGVTLDDIEEIYASSVKAENEASLAFDGDKGTRWESEHQVDPSWIAVKFKTKKELKAIRIFWEAAAGAEYQIEISHNGENWKNVKSVADGQESETRLIEFDKPVKARYL